MESTTRCNFILNGYIYESAYVNTSLMFSSENMTDVDFDAYQWLPMSYDPIAALLSEKSKPRTMGYYVWAYNDFFGQGVTWDSMTDYYLDSVYEQAIRHNATRVIVWNGYAPDPQDYWMHASCLYYYPEWWEKVRANNMRFLLGGELR